MIFYLKTKLIKFFECILIEEEMMTGSFMEIATTIIIKKYFQKVVLKQYVEVTQLIEELKKK